MAWGKLEDTFHDEPKFYRLSDHLGVSFAEAAGHVAILWSWAYLHAPDGDLRDFDVPDIERAAKWQGDRGEFCDALLSERINLLDRGEHGLLLHRFIERAESHKAAKKKAKQRMSRQRRAVVAGQSPDSPGNVPEERRGEERIREESVQETRASTHSRLGANHPEVAFFAARYLELFPGALVLDDRGRARAAEIVRRCSENQRRWQDVLEAFGDERWKFALGSLDWLRDHLAEVAQWIADGKPARKAAVTSGPTRGSVSDKHTKAAQLESDERRRREEVERAKATDPDAAKALVAGIVAALK